MSEIQKLEELLEKDSMDFLDNADSAYQEKKDQDAEKNIDSCVCRKCGNQLKCEHNSAEEHTESICGFCAG